MDIDALAAEITNDPLTRGYAGMTDVQVMDSLNTANRNRNKESVAGSDILKRVDATEFSALTTAQQDRLLLIGAIDSVDPFGPIANVITSLFAGGTNTRANLVGFRVETISRATELGLGTVAEGHVQEARRQ